MNVALKQRKKTQPEILTPYGLEFEYSLKGAKRPKTSSQSPFAVQFDGSYMIKLVNSDQILKIFDDKVRQLQIKFEADMVDPSVFSEYLIDNKYDFRAASKAIEKVKNRLFKDRFLKIFGGSMSIPEHCPVCFVELNATNTKYFGCGHAFCEDCMAMYLEQKSKEGAASMLKIGCQHEGCEYKATKEIVRDCSSFEVFSK